MNKFENPYGALVKLARLNGFKGAPWAHDPASFKQYAEQHSADAQAGHGEGWGFGVYDAVADAKLPPITYRDVHKLWPDSPERIVTQVIAPPKGLKTAFVMGELFALMLKGKARVKILALEGEYGVRTTRLKALAAHHNIPLADLRGRYEVIKIEGGDNV